MEKTLFPARIFRRTAAKYFHVHGDGAGLIRGNGWTATECVLSRESDMAGTLGDKDVERRITLLLQGDEADRCRAIALIDHHFRHALCGAARRYNRGMDLGNLWGETLSWFNSYSQGIDYDASKSPIPLLRKEMQRRAIDGRRRDVIQGRILQELANRLRGTHTGEWWQNLSPLERQEVQVELAKSIAGLPGRQGQVWRIFVLHFPATASMARLRELVEEEHGECVSLASVERALQEGRKKIRAIFAERGFS
jgi:hypothetical protein